MKSLKNNITNYKTPNTHNTRKKPPHERKKHTKKTIIVV